MNKIREEMIVYLTMSHHYDLHAHNASDQKASTRTASQVKTSYRICPYLSSPEDRVWTRANYVTTLPMSQAVASLRT